MRITVAGRTADILSTLPACGWSLNNKGYVIYTSRKRKPGEKDNAAPVRTCGACWLAYNPREHQKCPECGIAPEKRDTAVPEEIGQLTEVSATERGEWSSIKKLSTNPEIAALQKEAAEKGFKPGWVYYKRQEMAAAKLMERTT